MYHFRGFVCRSPDEISLIRLFVAYIFISPERHSKPREKKRQTHLINFLFRVVCAALENIELIKFPWGK